MADQFDMAQDADALFREASIKNRPRTEKLDPAGVCHNCYETVDYPTALFCDADCRDDYEARKRILTRVGK